MKILILCTGNSCRSQMAEGFLRHYMPEATIFSAGIEAHGLNPKAVEVMKEIGIDIGHHQSKTIDELPEDRFNVVLTVCDNARENCPYFPAERNLHYNFPDPAKAEGTEEEVMNAFRSCRDLIENYCKKFAKEILKKES